ncbi:MAG: hypothetical protein RIK87_02330 [Fuerstiella sp.]
MDKFNVWLRPLGDWCRIRVSGATNAGWLLQHLGQTFTLKNGNPAQETHDPDVFTFDVPCDNGNTRSRLEKALSSMQEVNLMMGPE